MVAVVQQARPVNDGFGVVLEPRGFGDGLVNNRFERAVRRGAERDALPGRGAVPQAEHLLARQHHPDGALEFPRRQHGQERLTLRPQPQPERTAHERRDDAQLALREAEHAAQVALNVLHALRLVVDR